MNETPHQIGRLAMRVEDGNWNAYYALSDTMEGALLLGSIRMALIENQERKDAFLTLMREAVADILEAQIGQRPSWPDGPAPAPKRAKPEPKPDAPNDRRHQAMERIVQGLMDQGLIVEAGWQIFRLLAMKPDTATPELDRCKEAFFAGAQHLFGSTMSALEEDAEPTDADMRRISNVAEELNRFSDQLKLKYGRAMGNA